MRAAFISMVAVVFASSLALGDENQSPKDSDGQRLQTYVIEITEVHLTTEAARGLKVKELAQSLEQLTKDGQVELLETVRLSVLTQHESTALFGRQTAVIQGVTATPTGRHRNMSSVRVGTSVHVSAAPHGDEDVLLRLKYESSRLGKEVTEEQSPDIETVMLTSELLLQPGKPVVAMSSTTQEGTYVLVSVAK